MERRFIEPLNERLFAGYERLAYAQALRDGDLPDNVAVSEFFLLAGRWVGVQTVQQSYVSADYTHAAGYLLGRDVNVIAQLVARRGRKSGRALQPVMQYRHHARHSAGAGSARTQILLVGAVCAALPFTGGDAEPRLFAPPKEPVSRPTMPSASMPRAWSRTAAHCRSASARSLTPSPPG